METAGVSNIFHFCVVLILQIAKGSKFTGGKADMKTMLKFENVDKNRDKKLSPEEVLAVFKLVRPNDYFLDSKVKGDCCGFLTYSAHLKNMHATQHSSKSVTRIRTDSFRARRMLAWLRSC